MKALFLTLGLALVSGSAHAKPIRLYGDHAVCTTIPIISKFVDTRRGKVDWERRLSVEIKQGRCGIAVAGTTVTVEDQVGMFSCVRPLDFPTDRCRWTVLHPTQLQ